MFLNGAPGAPIAIGHWDFVIGHLCGESMRSFVKDMG